MAPQWEHYVNTKGQQFAKPGTIMAPPWANYGATIGQPWYHHWTNLVHHGPILGLLLANHGTIIGLTWSTTGQLWDYHWPTMGPWDHPPPVPTQPISQAAKEATARLLARPLLWTDKKQQCSVCTLLPCIVHQSVALFDVQCVLVCTSVY